MLTLPDAIVAVLVPFATLFTSPTWRKAQLLLVGAILTPGQRTVAAALRQSHGPQRPARLRPLPRGVNRAGVVVPPGQRASCWQTVAPAPGWWRRPTDLRHRRDPGTASRRQDPGRGPSTATRNAFQPVSGGQGRRFALDARLMWLGHVPWAGRHWALPALTVLAPSTRYYQQQGRQHKKLTDWARPEWSCQLRRWLPHRPLAAGGRQQRMPCWICSTAARNTSAANPFTLIAQIGVWTPPCMQPAPPRQPGQNGRPPLKGPRRPPLKVFPCADGCNLGQRRGGLVRRHHPRRGTHLPDGGLVPLRQAPRPHSLGADPRPPGLLRQRPCSDT